MPQVDALSFGPAGGLRFSRNSGRSLTSEALGAIRYPSPFFDIAQTYLPSSFKTMLRWCRYYFLTNPIINAACYKMAEYPVTDLVFDSTNEPLRGKWEYLFHRVLSFKKFEVETGLDYYTYGNTFVSISFPFHKLLICKKCGFTERADNQKYLFREYKFVGDCKRCHANGEFRVRDHYVRSVRDIRLIRWNPEYITVQHNDATAEDRYYYSIPPQMANDVRMAKRHIIERVPQVFIEALRQNKALLFSRDNIYHLKRPTIAQKDKGWGMPMILPVLKDCFYIQILRKANECVALDTLIESSSGLIKADDVKVGDLVRTHTGNFHKVVEKWYRDAREEEIGRKITLSGLRAFPSTYSPHHPIFILRRKEGVSPDTKNTKHPGSILERSHLYEEVACPAEQLQVGDYVLYPRNLPEEPQTIDVAKYTGFSKTDGFVYSGCSEEAAESFEALERGEHVAHDNAGRVAKRCVREERTPKRLPAYIPLDEDFAYILGWYVGDGSCGGRHIEFTIGQSDPRAYDDAIRAAAKKVFGVECTCPEGKSTRHLNLCDVIVQKLIKGLIPGLAKTKRIPFEIMNSSKPIKLAFLKGLFESDGHYGEDKNTLFISSQNLSYDTYRILISLGCIATVSKRNTPVAHLKDGRTIKGGTAYPLEVCSASKDRLMSLWECGNGQEVTTGKSGFFWNDKYFVSRVSAVEEIEEAQYIDFKVETDHTFCMPGTAGSNSISIEHIVPLRLLFPQTSSNQADVYSTINLTQWRDKIEQELVRWRLDNNYIPLLPIPVGQETLGGEGKALMLAQEYRVWTEQIVAGLHVPIEFIYGGASYSGGNLSLRMLENHFIDQRSQRMALINDFVLPNIGAFMGWEQIPVHYKPFKMADDLQRGAFNLQLNQAGKLSDRTLLEFVDRDYRTEINQIAEEQKTTLENQRSQAMSQAAIQGEAQLVGIKYQGRAQKIMLEQTGSTMAPQDTKQMADQASQAAGLPGVASPVAAGQQVNTQVGAMNQMGQIPPVDLGQPDSQGQSAQPNPMEQVQSPLNQGQQGARMDLTMIAQRVAGWLNQLQDQEKQREMIQMQRANPQLYQLVLSMIQTTAGADKPSNAKPLPEEKPPQRGTEAALV